jgi:hypothetical protein
MVMKPMNKKLVVRITDSQARWLIKVLTQMNVSKSELVRNALNSYLIQKANTDEIVEKK